MTAQMDAGGLAVATVLGLAIWLPAAWAVGRRLGWTAPAMLAAAFALGSIATGAAATIAWALGSTLTLTMVLTGALAIAFVPLAWRFRGGGTVRPGFAGLVLGAAVGGLAFWQRPWFSATADTFYHLAAARSLIMRDAPLVTDPFHGTVTTALDPTSGVFHTWLAASARVSSAGVEYLYAGFAALAAAVVVWAFWGLAERVSRSAAIATVSALAFAAFGLWGDFRMAGMPNRFTVAFLCVALLGLLDTTTAEGRRPAALALLWASGAALLTHLASASALLLFAGAAGVAAAAFGRGLRGAASSAPRLTALVPALALAAPALASKVSTILASTMTGQPDTLPEAFVALGPGLLWVKPGKYVGGGPVAFGLMAALAAWAVFRGLRDRDGATLTLGALLTVPVVLLNVPPVTALAADVSLYMLTRIVLMMKFLPFLAAAWAIGALARTSRPDTAQPSEARRWALAAAGAALLVAHGLASWQLTEVTFVRVEDRMRLGEAQTVAESREADVRASWGLQALWQARDVFGDSYPVVAASPDTGYYLAGLADIAIITAPESHTPLTVKLDSGQDRRADMERLFEPGTGEAERRRILDRWDAEYVALSFAESGDENAWEDMRAQTGLFEPVVEARRLIVLRVRR